MKLRRLTEDEVNRFASRKGVKKIAVENFLISVTANEIKYNAVQNAYYDQRLYKWNSATLKAILDGIDLACKQ